MTLITGGQDESKVTAAAAKSGWKAGSVLTRELDLSHGTAAVAGISIVAPKIRPIDKDVVLSQTRGDPTGIAAAGSGAPSPADQLPAMQAAINCLGNVSLALGTGIRSADPVMVTVVGSGPGSASSTSSVICLGATDAAAAKLVGRQGPCIVGHRSEPTQSPALERTADVPDGRSPRRIAHAGAGHRADGRPGNGDPDGQRTGPSRPLTGLAPLRG